MRITVRIRQLKEQARRENVALTRVLDRTLRAGLRPVHRPAARRRPYREATHRLGAPRADVDKAFALAAKLKDEEIIRKMMLRK